MHGDPSKLSNKQSVDKMVTDFPSWSNSRLVEKVKIRGMPTSASEPGAPTSTANGTARVGRQERFNRNENVMEAAIAVMSERGYAATSVQEIADRVGVLKGSLYHYFSSKEELLFRVLSESHAEADRIADEVKSLDLEPIDELLEYLRRLCLWFLTHVDRANIYFTDSRQLTGDRFVQTQRLGRQFVKHLNDLIVAARGRDQIASALDTTVLTDFVLGSLNSVRAWPIRSGRKLSHEKMADAFVELTRNALQAKSVTPRVAPQPSPSPARRRRTSSAGRTGSSSTPDR
jgi:AcrR family transcriptional regulator